MTTRTLVSCCLLAFTGSNIADASTCSCAGVPLLGAMELATPGSGQWYLGSTYEFHDVSELVRGSSSVSNAVARDRTSQALVFEVSRGLGRRFSFSAMLSAIEHERDVGGVRDTASGLGDAIVLLKYSPASISLYSKNALSFGIGARVPVGEDSANRGGITLAEDMQPSTGASGGLLWLYAARALNESRGARIYGTLSYARNGENDRDYSFGDETTMAVGGSYQTSSPLGYNLELVYRHTERDERGSVRIPNTGGNWLNLVPSVQYHLTESLAVKAAAKIPVARDLNDQLQFTTKYALRVSVSYVFGR